MEDNYGLLVNQNTKLHRQYFNEMVKLLGVNVKYRSPLQSGTYTLHGEYTSINYTEPVTVGCIFQEHLDQRTSKKLGWDAELLKPQLSQFLMILKDYKLAVFLKFQVHTIILHPGCLGLQNSLLR